MTVPALLQVAAPLIGLAINVVSQLLIFRVHTSIGLLRSEYLGFAAGFLTVMTLDGFCMIGLPFGNWTDLAGITLLTTLTYGALGYNYFHFINLGETARRIRLLRELYAAGGALTHQQLLNRYPAREIVNKRIKRLLGTGQVICREKRYFIGNRTVVHIAIIMTALKKLLLGKTSEYDT